MCLRWSLTGMVSHIPVRYNKSVVVLTDYYVQGLYRDSNVLLHIVFDICVFRDRCFSLFQLSSPLTRLL